ncbi:molybdopterin-binding protein [Anaerolineales bacterium HSG6]|nr:molybdopterin-binding protein [Anaerolineales bacterium HSG6]MDM8529803.1 molybdopterin-binding protein [Anaerolineales bacterium HSG25]
MDIRKLPLEKSIGHILIHNLVGKTGRRLLSKGHLLKSVDLPTLQASGQDTVYVAVLANDDIGENEAARQLGSIVCAESIRVTKATTGRVSLIAKKAGVFKVNIAGLLTLNEISGITLATLSNNTTVSVKKILATLKIIPYAIPQKTLRQAHDMLAYHKPLITINPFVLQQAILITIGREIVREKVVGSFTPPIRERLTGYGTSLISGPYVSKSVTDISKAIKTALSDGMDLIILAGETSTMDEDDIIPRAIKQVGGQIIQHGVPVEPGNLLMLGYYQDIPIVGAPGCARSLKHNVIDMVLPRLVSGERLTRQDLVALGHGGYLK